MLLAAEHDDDFVDRTSAGERANALRVILIKFADKEIIYIVLSQRVQNLLSYIIIDAWENVLDEYSNNCYRWKSLDKEIAVKIENYL